MTRKLHGDRVKGRRARATKQAAPKRRARAQKVAGTDPRQKGYWPKVEEAILRALGEAKGPMQGIEVARRAKLTAATAYNGLRRLRDAKRVVRRGRGGRGVTFERVKEVA